MPYEPHSRKAVLASLRRAGILRSSSSLTPSRYGLRQRKWHIAISSWLAHRMEAVRAGELPPLANIREAMALVDETLDLLDLHHNFPLTPRRYAAFVYFVMRCDQIAAGTFRYRGRNTSNLPWARARAKSLKETGK